MSCYERFHQALRERGFRLTAQRAAIVEALHDTGHKPVTAEAIHQLVADREDAADLATVYRTLEMLQEIGFAKLIDTGRKERLWEFTGPYEPHGHLLCRTCGKVVPIDLAELEELTVRLREEYGFDLDTAQVTLPGQCPTCRILEERAIDARGGTE